MTEDSSGVRSTQADLLMELCNFFTLTMQNFVLT